MYNNSFCINFYTDTSDYVELNSSNNPLVPFTSDPSTHRQCFDVTIINDDVLEDTEGFSLSLTLAGDSSVPVVVRPDVSEVEIVDGDGRNFTTYLTMIHLFCYFHCCSHPCWI